MHIEMQDAVVSLKEKCLYFIRCSNIWMGLDTLKDDDL